MVGGQLVGRAVLVLLFGFLLDNSSSKSGHIAAAFYTF